MPRSTVSDIMALDEQRSAAEQAAWESSFLGTLPEVDQEELRRHSISIRVPAGQPLYSAYGPPRLALLVVGLSRVFTSSSDGRHSTIRYARPGDCTGIMSVVTSRQEVNSEALLDCEALFIDVPTIRRLALVSPEVGWAVAQEVGRTCSDVIDLMSNTAFGSIRERLARHLLDLADSTAEGPLVTVDQQEMADAIGSVREVVARALRALRAEGLIVRTPRGLLLVNLSQLHVVARGN